MDDVQRMISALRSPIRREILWMINDEERAAGEIAAAMRVTAPTVSEHLRILREAGLVAMRVDGTFRRYRARRDALGVVQRGLLAESGHWTPASGIPERELAEAVLRHAACVTVEVACPRERVFTGFTDPALYSRWLGAPVRLDEGRFAATLAWGTQVRGRYEHVVAPELIVMCWDFAADVPVPGTEHRAYAHFTDTADGGCRVEVNQLVDTAQQAEFMQNAWRFVLGRLAGGVSMLRE